MKSRIWDQIEVQLTAGNFDGLFVAGDGRLVLPHNGKAVTLPDRLVGLVPADQRAAAQGRQDALAAVKRSNSQAIAAQLRERRAALDLRLDEPGFRLLAGEETAIVAKGTLRECRQEMHMVRRQPRDRYCGKGCWVILDAAGVEVERGQFDKDMVW